MEQQQPSEDIHNMAKIPVSPTLLPEILAKLEIEHAGTMPFSSPDALSLALHDKEWKVRLAAVRTLRLSAIEGVENLLTIVLHDENEFVRMAAEHALEYRRYIASQVPLNDTLPTKKSSSSEKEERAAPDPVIPVTTKDTPRASHENWHVPYQRNPYFTGRDITLEKLHQALHTFGVAIITHAKEMKRSEGIGKTQLAIEYAYRYRQEYKNVLWLNATTMLPDVIRLGSFFNIPVQDYESHPISVTINAWLAHQKDWLLILDDITDMKSISDILLDRARRGGYVLLTSQNHAVSSTFPVIEIEKMDLNEGALFLLHRAHMTTDEANRVVALDIVAVLDGLPLAIDQAGTYIDQTSSSLIDYLILYQKKRKELIEKRDDHDGSSPVAAVVTWLLAFQKIKQVNRMAANLLSLCAFLEPEMIPEEMIIAGAHGQEALAVDLIEAIELGQKYALIRRHEGTKTFSLHRIVQVMLIDIMPPQMQRYWVVQAVQAINYMLLNEDIELQTKAERYLSQAQACIRQVDYYKIESSDVIPLFQQVGSLLRHYAFYEDAEQLLQRSLLMMIENKKQFDPSAVTTVLYELAQLYQKQKKYKQAETFYQRAFTTHELRPELAHPSTVVALKNYIMLLRETQREDEADILEARIWKDR